METNARIGVAPACPECNELQGLGFRVPTVKMLNNWMHGFCKYSRYIPPKVFTLVCL